MSLNEILRAVKEHELAQRQLQASELAVWSAVAKVEQSLAGEILSLFVTTDDAARWVASKLDVADCSPAQYVAEGRAAEILSKVRRTAHGFVG